MLWFSFIIFHAILLSIYIFYPEFIRSECLNIILVTLFLFYLQHAFVVLAVFQCLKVIISAAFLLTIGADDK